MTLSRSSRFSPDCSPQTFGIPLFQVIANDRAYRRLQEAVGKSRRLCLEVEMSVTKFRAQRQKRSPMGRSFGLVPCGVFPEEPLSPAFPDNIARSQRRVRLWKRAAPCWVGAAPTSAISVVSQGLLLRNVSDSLWDSPSLPSGKWNVPDSPTGWTVRGGTRVASSALKSQGDQKDVATQPQVEVGGGLSPAAWLCLLLRSITSWRLGLALEKFPPEALAINGGSLPGQERSLAAPIDLCVCLEVMPPIPRSFRGHSSGTVLGSWGVVPATLQTTSALSQGAMSVDSITDLSDNASKLLEALQLSHPHELDPRRSLGKEMLSLNPITWQVPRIVDRCCEHIEAHGKYACLHGGLVEPITRGGLGCSGPRWKEASDSWGRTRPQKASLGESSGLSVASGLRSECCCACQ